MQKIYVVRLSGDERVELEAMLKGGKTSSLKLTRARILLKADQEERQPAWTDAEIAEAVGVSIKTVFNVRRKWMDEGTAGAIDRKKQQAPSRQLKIDGEAEAKLVATCCGPAPEGRARWTMRLLADKVVELGIVDSISPETIRQTLKKMRLSLG